MRLKESVDRPEALLSSRVDEKTFHKEKRMRRNSQGNLRKTKTNGKKTFLVGAIGQLCGIILKGQTLANVQKTPSDPGLFTTLANHLEEGKQGGLAGYS